MQKTVLGAPDEALLGKTGSGNSEQICAASLEIERAEILGPQPPPRPSPRATGLRSGAAARRSIAATMRVEGA